MELGLGSPQAKEWVWFKFTFRFDPLKEYIRFLRCPGPEDGPGYRVTRAGVIVALRVRRLLGRPHYILD